MTQRITPAIARSVSTLFIDAHGLARPALVSTPPQTVPTATIKPSIPSPRHKNHASPPSDDSTEDEPGQGPA